MHACIAATDRSAAQAAAAGKTGSGDSGSAGSNGVQPQQTMARLWLDEGQVCNMSHSYEVSCADDNMS